MLFGGNFIAFIKNYKKRKGGGLGKKEMILSILSKTEIKSTNEILEELQKKADKLINNAEILLSKAEESYNKGLYENSIDLAVEAKIKSIEAKSVIG